MKPKPPWWINLLLFILWPVLLVFLLACIALASVLMAGSAIIIMVVSWPFVLFPKKFRLLKIKGFS